MRFSHTELNGELEWTDIRHINELVVESPAFLRSVLRDLSADEANCAKLTNGGKPMNMPKEIDLICNPLDLNFNNRRAMATLLKMLVKASLSDELYMETNEFKSRVIKYLDEVVDSESFVFEVAADDFAIDNIAKAVNLHIVDDEDDFVDLLTDYMSMMAELAGIKLFVFLNLRTMLSDGELARLIGNINNHQLDIFLIEGHQFGKVEDCGRIIVDVDLCEI